MIKKIAFLREGPGFLLVLLMLSCTFNSYSQVLTSPLPLLKISANGRYFMYENGDPFFWLGDTAWLLFSKLNREDAIKYLDDRSKKGFNVLQVSLVHSVSVANVYGDSALVKKNVAKPNVTKGNSYQHPEQYDYWDHVDYIIDEAAKRGIYLAMVPVWGGNVKKGWVKQSQAKIYAKWLADRYRNKRNIIWINGGDIPGSTVPEVWKTIGGTLRANDPNHLITFHPFGRTISSIWFQQEKWLDFNMFQSGHQNYEQDTLPDAPHFGEDNYKYVQGVYNKKPAKPVLDGEPSYEGMPYGLHDTSQPRWRDYDVRRYAYWSVFEGAAGFTYGDNAVMQMHKPSDSRISYGARDFWFDAINDPGSSQMGYLKKLLLSKPYFERVPDSTLVTGHQGTRYNFLAATRGTDYIFIYTYNGRNFSINMGKIAGTTVKAHWYNPRDGRSIELGTFVNKGVAAFAPPGEMQDGNDWVLVVEKNGTD